MEVLRRLEGLLDMIDGVIGLAWVGCWFGLLFPFWRRGPNIIAG